MGILQTTPHTRIIASLITALSLMAALFISTPSNADTQSEDSVEISQGSVTWGIKESWRKYIGTGGIHGIGGSTLTDGAEWVDGVTSEIKWPVIGGSFDKSTNTTILKLGGKARFQAYPLSDGSFQLDSQYSDLRVEISPERQVIIATYTGFDRETGDPVSDTETAIATIDTTTGSHEVADSTTSYSKAKTYATSATGLYPGGTPYDPISFEYTGPGGLPELGDVLTPPSTPSFEPASTWISAITTNDKLSVYTPDNSDVVHVVQRNNDTKNPVYTVRALSPSTMEPVATREVELGDMSYSQIAFDSKRGDIYMIKVLKSSSDDLEIKKISFDQESKSYRETTAYNYTFPKASIANYLSMSWDGNNDRLIIIANDRTVENRLQPEADLILIDSRGPHKYRLHAPDTNRFTEASSITAGLFSGNNQNKHAPEVLDRQITSQMTGLTDGSIVLTTDASLYNKSGEEEQIGSLRLTQNGDEFSVKEIPGTFAPRAPNAPNMIYNYSQVTSATDGGAYLYDSLHSRHIAKIDLEASGSLAVKPFKVEGDDITASFYGNTHDYHLNYFFNGASQTVNLVDGAEVKSKWRFDDIDSAFDRGAFSVSDTGDMYISVKDPDSGKSGIRRFAFEGLTASVSEHPKSQTVDLKSNTSKKVTFTAKGKGDDVTQAWQVKKPGAKDFETIEGVS